MASVFVQDPDGAVMDIAFLVDSGISDKDIRRNLPARVVPHLVFADHLEQKGDLDQADALYLQSLTYINNEKEVMRPIYFYRVSKFFRKQKRYEEGLNVILQGIELFPADAGLKVGAGILYQYMGLEHRAIEQYQQALIIEQGNSPARKNLEKMQQALYKKNRL